MRGRSSGPERDDELDEDGAGEGGGGGGVRTRGKFRQPFGVTEQPHKEDSRFGEWAPVYIGEQLTVVVFLQCPPRLIIYRGGFYKMPATVKFFRKIS